MHLERKKQQMRTYVTSLPATFLHVRESRFSKFTPHMSKQFFKLQALFFTSCDVVMAKYDLLCYTAAHTDVHLG